ncbi:dihydrodipicolinate reductase [Mycobacterium florentinum]|uniref:Dihydrodipicolinate reductase n=1 Tax=Mycobacterium florentinum TaxID=292462 RepID=A0A1X1TYV4_MYCFL|nr:dihydrodipicolinate reductase [Mycobacterium florentinum]MCV7409133.1 dihydrodipicolinate reductase [Mycobacterium florentinum]ORV49772.1 dihydrodipicolinate reductase [Mycobacterium florentinum]BBX78744.1 dihydrodipicolinate reductase [Mycobacterium florentinum]
MTYRVIQWSTGNIGKRALGVLIDRNDFEVVGVHAYGSDKVGRDAGVLGERPPIGVAATDDVDALIELAPDCVNYMPRAIDFELVARLLRSGINVVTTGDFLTGSYHPTERAALEAAAHDGGATFLGTGFEPGFINVVAGFLTGACRKVDSVKLVETLDCTTYPVQDVWKVLGFGKPPRGRVKSIDPQTQRYGLGYFETLDMIAGMLGVELDSTEAFVENAVLTRDLQLGWTDYAAGTTGGQRRSYRGYRNGRPVIELAICWTMSSDALDPQWEDPEGFSVVIDGEPYVDATIRFGHPGQDAMTVLMDSTAVAAVNAVPFLCDAPPGVITPIDLPIIGSRGAMA